MINEDFSDYYPDLEPETIESLEKKLSEAKQEAKDNWDALKLLMSICKARGFEPFPGEELYKPLTVHPSELSKEELIERNKEATVRIAKTHHVDSQDKTQMPTYEEQNKVFEKRAADSKIGPKMLELLEQLRLPPGKRVPGWTVLLASCKDPIDPNENDLSIGMDEDD